MKKIEKFLNQSGWSCVYENYDWYSGKKGWSNSGSFKLERYKITKGGDRYYIFKKVTGRPYFRLCYENTAYSTYGALDVGFSQQEFIDRIDKHINKDNKYCVILKKYGDIYDNRPIDGKMFNKKFHAIQFKESLLNERKNFGKGMSIYRYEVYRIEDDGSLHKDY